MKRTSGSLAVLVALLAVGGAVAASRLGPAGAPPTIDPIARSGSWYCPHGGGKGWKGTLALANPGDVEAQVRITSMSDSPATDPVTLTVPPGREVLRPLDADARSSATAVETFDGYVAAGWLVRSGAAPSGLGAEPCLAIAGTSWTSTDLSTQQGDEAFLVVMNPFAAQAVVELAIFSPDQAPLRDPEWMDVRIAPRRSMVFDVGARVPGKDAVTVVLNVDTGRVAAGSLATAADGSVRSAVAAPTTPSLHYLPVVGGSGSSTLVVGVTGEEAVRFDAVLRSRGEPQPAGGLIDVRQGALSTGTYPVTTGGPSLIEVAAAGEHPIAVSLRAGGRAADGGATGGTDAAASAWIVTPTAVEEPWFPGLVIANPGPDDVTVEARTLPAVDGIEATEVSFRVAAGRAIAPPKRLLRADPRGAVLIQASGPVIALGGSSSSGRRGFAWYALAMGSPVPAWALGSDGT